MEKLERPNIFEINLLYLILGLLLLFGGYFVQSKEIYSGMLITEFIIILLPNISYLKFKGYSIKDVLRFNKISLKQIAFIILIIVFAYPIAVFLNFIAMTILGNFTDASPTSVPIPTSNGEFLLGLFVIAAAPGICEEIMFRGTMMLGYDKMGYKKSIIITSILFGIFHFNAMNLLAPIFLGMILGLLVHKTNSILSTMLAHFLNNAIALSIGFFLTKYMNNLQFISIIPEISEQMEILLSFIFFGSLALVSTVIIIFLFKHMPESEPKELIYELELDRDILEINNGFNSIKYVPLLIVFIIFIFMNFIILI
ncbi:type II CAAX endopeptidase family protein [Paratissierella segnis]|jgi:hypothetical protein|uniref:CPBP family intramembrane metalloprotease n=1 Tax=Paratissierella segnis TaxID=2763679 RepID=A0A926ILB1_9FIRM|nr:type II CAAX endopeptidase family protein [Paratissierella segnis]MBC8589381.1 CPBP family intramembrane metalloprotease [Paratissierella segnis]